MDDDWDNATPNNSHRGFVSPFTVQYTGAQRNRFGRERRKEIQSILFLSHDQENDYPEDFKGEWEDFPRVSRLRVNLTALSQHHNLYFVAYRSWIHVYVPQRGRDVVVGRPLAILNPELSKTPVSEHKPGHVSRALPQSVNHLQVGDLGDKEILLAARDNGDVVAWYTDIIARAVEQQLALLARREASGKEIVPPPLRPKDKDYPPPQPRHFFAENVGNSAWGLAIHKRDRLIAVSSNNAEVTVFAFALGGDEADSQFENMSKDPMPTEDDSAGKGKSEESSSVCNRCSASRHRLIHLEPIWERLQSLRKSFPTRTRFWRIIVPMSAESGNLPSVTFCEDEAGHADRVAAIDIHGWLWIAEIWTFGSGPVKVPPHNVPKPTGFFDAEDITGWNVLAITDAQLLPTRTLKQAMGLNPKDAVYRGRYPNRGSWIDISGSMVAVPDNAAISKHEEYSESLRRPDQSSEYDGLSPDFYIPSPPGSLNVGKLFKPAPVEDEDKEIKLGMIMVPATGEYHTEVSDLETFDNCIGQAGAFDRQENMPEPQILSWLRREKPDSAMLRNISFLRANEEDVEMLTLDDAEHDVGQVCHHVLTNINVHRRTTPWDMRYAQRCSMLLTIPELHLVVLGSMCGRVALLTLTKPPDAHATAEDHDLPRRPRRAFRVDSVLPFKSNEDEFPRPQVCLLGIAVSPMPETESVAGMRRRRPTAYGGRRRGAGAPPEMEPEAPRRWRLLLYYMDHTILKYEIAKRASAEEDDDTVAAAMAMPWGERPRRRRRMDIVERLAPLDDERDLRTLFPDIVPQSPQVWYNGQYLRYPENLGHLSDESIFTLSGTDTEDGGEGNAGEEGGA